MDNEFISLFEFGKQNLFSIICEKFDFLLEQYANCPPCKKYKLKDIKQKEKKGHPQLP